MSDKRIDYRVLIAAGVLFVIAGVASAFAGLRGNALGYGGAAGFLALGTMFMGAGLSRRKQARGVQP